jgi:hypothetical protein
MNSSAFAEIDFLLLICFSIILPIGIYGYMMWKKSIARISVLVFGAILIVIAGIDIFLLQRLSDIAKTTPSLLDDRIFVSEISVALYLFPALYAGVGANMISHILIRHLTIAERKFEHEE